MELFFTPNHRLWLGVPHFFFSFFSIPYLVLDCIFIHHFHDFAPAPLLFGRLRALRLLKSRETNTPMSYHATTMFGC